MKNPEKKQSCTEKTEEDEKLKNIQMEIVRLNAIYPNPQPLEVLEIRASVWLEDLGHLSEEMISRSIKLHRIQSRFFPTIADILECYREIVQNISKPCLLGLPEPRIDFTIKEEALRKKMVQDFKNGKRKKRKAGPSGIYTY